MIMICMIWNNKKNVFVGWYYNHFRLHRMEVWTSKASSRLEGTSPLHIRNTLLGVWRKRRKIKHGISLTTKFEGIPPSEGRAQSEVAIFTMGKDIIFCKICQGSDVEFKSVHYSQSYKFNSVFVFKTQWTIILTGDVMHWLQLQRAGGVVDRMPFAMSTFRLLPWCLMERFQSLAVSRPLTYWNSFGVSHAFSNNTHVPLLPSCSRLVYNTAWFCPQVTSRRRSSSLSVVKASTPSLSVAMSPLISSTASGLCICTEQLSSLVFFIVVLAVYTSLCCWETIIVLINCLQRIDDQTANDYLRLFVIAWSCR